MIVFDFVLAVADAMSGLSGLRRRVAANATRQSWAIIGIEPMKPEDRLKTNGALARKGRSREPVLAEKRK